MHFAFSLQIESYYPPRFCERIYEIASISGDAVAGVRGQALTVTPAREGGGSVTVRALDGRGNSPYR
jgi:hypothetical protein